MSDYLAQNAIYFIIFPLSCPIFLTFGINLVLKFKYQASQIKDNGVFGGGGDSELFYSLFRSICLSSFTVLYVNMIKVWLWLCLSLNTSGIHSIYISNLT